MDMTPKLSWLLLICTLFMLLPGVWAQYVDMGNAAAKRPASLNQPRSLLRVLKPRNSKGLNAVVTGEGDYEDDDEDQHKYMSECDSNDEKFIDPKRQNIHVVNINTVNMDDEEDKQMKAEREFKQAIMELMKPGDNTVAGKPLNRVENGAGMDFKLEFASDEANPYI